MFPQPAKLPGFLVIPGVIQQQPPHLVVLSGWLTFHVQELRFIFPALPIFNASAAIAVERM
jgi:hypothetical protein